ncbi:conjugal transfer protein TraW [Trinickia dabaoshanensis]|uniref:conjugal transfer protein TraW n=1 Tax=Trinickia dabaoshanensis TaxID=564714 RepID=UPI0011AF5DF1|nr:conjugal transfer protein TraW [Trinickia dabaoshanensis]
MRMKVALPAGLCLALGLSASANAYAVCDGCVVAAVTAANVAITGAIGSLGSALEYELNSIDSDIEAIGGKVSATSTTASNTEREMTAQAQQQGEIDSTLKETELPLDPCATSSSIYAMQAMHSVNTTASSYRPGGGASVQNDTLRKALNGPTPSVEASRRASTSIHELLYCDANEAVLGYPECKTASSMPDGDASADSLYSGAGMPGKDADLTYNPQQLEAARAYERMSIDPEPPQYITRAEEGTEVGKLYIAMQKAYMANMTSAANTLNSVIASRAPFADGAKLISEINASSDSAQRYFNANASPGAKKLGSMSLAELEEFEAGRRWRNPYWQIEMGAVADPTKLAREQLYTTAFMADLSYQNYQRSQHIEVLLAQILAVMERTGERPLLDAQLQRVHATNAR